MATTAIIPIHAGKGRPIAATLKMSVGYIENPEKTGGGQWVTSFQCDPLIADVEFLFSKNLYAAITGRDQGARDVLAYHLRVSFKPGEIDAATANKIGYDLAMKLCKARNAFVCCTHLDRDHIHTHIVINSTNLDCSGKFRNFKGSSFAVRRIADRLCIENGLSIITEPKPSRGSYGKWQGGGRPQSNREKLERMIDAALQKAKDYDTFIAAMIAAGCEVKQGKNPAFKIPGAGRFARCSSLGEDYTEEAIRERLMGLRKVIRQPVADETFVPFVITSQTRFTLLIDIQQKIQEGKGEAYERWVRLHNIKQAARTLIYLKENGIKSYDELAEKTSAASADYKGRLTKIKAIEQRLGEISLLQKHIGAYGKTREIYKQYRSAKNRAKFYEEHRADIAIHEAAKKHFDALGYGRDKKLPPMNALKQEYATLLAEKKKLYAGYKELKAGSMDLLRAKDNVERILGISQNVAGRDAGREEKNRNRGAR
jgi:hypothetical protein